MKLLEPIDAGGVQLKNRLVFPAYETNWATEDGHLTSEIVHLWKLVAQGGCGLIFAQCTNVNPDMEHRYTPFITSLHDDSFIPEYRRGIEEVKALMPDVKIAIQFADKSILGRHISPKDLTIEEIKDIIEYLAQGARRAKKAGFDAVEFHAAHCYTLADFLSKRGNNRPRQDPYGNTKIGRLRMQQEVIIRTRELAGNIPIVYRFNGDDFIVEGNTVKDGIYIAQALEEAGVNILSISAGGRRDEGQNCYSVTRSVPRAYYEDACNVHIAERIKKHVSIPLITVGKIGTIKLANEVLEEGRADLVAMARQLFCDPFTLKKTLEGREGEILRCSWCRKCHISYLAGGIAICSKKAWQKTYMPQKFRERARTL
jgi:2,4-dienoyl-CoA reductase-like NADH-dependent reductase (Old Yellow Enzyme family)